MLISPYSAPRITPRFWPVVLRNLLVWRKLGLRLSAVSAENVAQTSQQLRGGLTVTEICVPSVAAKAGIQRGDILIGLHQWETSTLDNVAFVLNHPERATFTPIRFYIIRAGQIRQGWLPQLD